MITIFKNIHTTSNPYHREIDSILERIRVGASKDLIFQIRTESDKNKRNELKKNLPSICFSGKFNVRKKESCLEHSGFICLDFDNFGNDEVQKENREKLIKDKYSYSVFTSPSGNGLKVIVKIPTVIEDHEKYFKTLQDYYNSEYFDKNTKDISRVCYESFDPKIYINKESELWKEKEEHEVYTYSEKAPTLPLTSTNQIITNLQTWFDKNFNLAEGSRNNNMFVFASAFNDYGISQNEAEIYLSRFATKGFSNHEINNIIKSAYSKKENHGTKYFEDVTTKKLIKSLVRSGKEIKKIYKEIKDVNPEKIDSVIDEINTNTTISEFWYFDKNGKCHVSNYKFKLFLEQNGYCKYYPEDGDNFIFIKIENSFLENTTSQHIKDFVLCYLLEQKEMIPYEMIASSTKYFKEDYLSLLKSVKLNIYEDEENFTMLYFKNFAVKIFKDKIEEIDYLNLNGYVWKDHVINRDYVKSSYDGSLFDKFILKVSGENEERKQALMNVIGFLCHSFKTPANNKAIIFNDEMISENPNGGSGKGIICNAINKLKRVSILDGKQFDFNKSFPYQTVSIDTQILIFDDVKKNFPFEGLFSLITEGITLEKKNKDAIKIPVQKSPKIVITTNYTVGGVGGSFERRKYEVELSSYFNANHTPLDEFGLMLFDDFSKSEWTKFDNFMINCIQGFLKNGLLKHEFHNLVVRKFIGDTSFEFYEWVTEGNMDINIRNYKTEKFNMFIEEYPDFKKFLSQKKFSKWIDIYGIYIGKKTIHGKSQEGRWVMFDELKEEEICPF